MTDEQRRTRAQPERRSIDVRLAVLERDVGEVANLVRQIDASLRFPESSPVGRALIARADTNRDNIAKLRTDLDATRASLVPRSTLDEMGDRVDAHDAILTELLGVTKALRLVALLLGIIVAIFTLAQVV